MLVSRSPLPVCWPTAPDRRWADPVRAQGGRGYFAGLGGRVGAGCVDDGRGVDRGPRYLRSSWRRVEGWSRPRRCRCVGRSRLTVAGRAQFEHREDGVTLLTVGRLVGVLVFMLATVAQQTCRRTPSAIFAYWHRADDPLSTDIKFLYYIGNKVAGCTKPGRSYSTQKGKSHVHSQNSDQRINQLHHLNPGKGFFHSEDKQH